tara:strand:- start:2437 stop:3078 length:642 start_codon:yes stop_codon:yes gene_type:complete
MIEKNNRKLFRPFGPTIGKTSIPEDIVNKINTYVDNLAMDEAKSKEQDAGANLAGNVSQEFDLDSKFATECGWTEFLSKECAYWIRESTGKKIKKFSLIGTWIVRQFQNEYNPLHYHGGHISGVGYLKVPKSFGATFQKSKKNNNNGQINLVHGSRQFLSDCLFKIEPKVGNFYFFPNYLLHTVYPFYNETEERRSISFNALIDEEIYNVYSN